MATSARVFSRPAEIHTHRDLFENARVGTDDEVDDTKENRQDVARSRNAQSLEHDQHAVRLDEVSARVRRLF